MGTPATGWLRRGSPIGTVRSTTVIVVTPSGAPSAGLVNATTAPLPDTVGGSVDDHVVTGRPGSRRGRHQLPGVELTAALGDDEAVDVPALVVVVVAEQVEGELGLDDDDTTIGADDGRDRVAGPQRLAGTCDSSIVSPEVRSVRYTVAA